MERGQLRLSRHAIHGGGVCREKYAFVSDVMRLVVLEQYGGVYFDTDVEVLRDISPLLDDEGFIGFENDQYVASGLTIAVEAHHPVIQAMIEEYKSCTSPTRTEA